MAATPGRSIWPARACRFACRGFAMSRGARFRCGRTRRCRVSARFNDLRLKRVLYGISCRNDEAAAEAIPGAIGLSGSTVSRTFIQASAAKLREFQARDLSGEGRGGRSLGREDMRRWSSRSASRYPGRNASWASSETDTENEKVLTPFLRSLVERGLDGSQGGLVILDGGKGLRSSRTERLPGSGPGPPLPVAHARERGEVPGQA